MDKFEQEEIKGRRWFSSFVRNLKTKSEWVPTEDKYDHIDGYLKQGNIEAIIEIKTRKEGYKNFTTIWMELSKYMNMMKVKADKGCKKALYVNFFGEDTMYIFDLKHINSNSCKIIDKWVPATSSANTGYKWKKFLEIPTSFASKFVKVNNCWTKIMN